MHETFKNVSIFIMFIITIMLWSVAKDYLVPYFDFRYGKTVLLCVWATFVVIFFHLLYYYFGKTQEKTIYFSTLIYLITAGCLVYFQKLPLA